MMETMVANGENSDDVISPISRECRSDWEPGQQPQSVTCLSIVCQWSQPFDKQMKRIYRHK